MFTEYMVLTVLFSNRSERGSWIPVLVSECNNEFLYRNYDFPIIDISGLIVLSAIDFVTDFQLNIYKMFKKYSAILFWHLCSYFSLLS